MDVTAGHAADAETVPTSRRAFREALLSPGPLRAAAGWAGCVAAALLLALCSGLAPHRIWGASAAVGYAGAVWPAARGRRRTAAAVAAAGAVGLPLLVLVLMGRAQLEVEVVARSAQLLLASGSPYAPDPVRVADFDPYLPAMAVFGIPDALFGAGPLTDPRLWTGAAFLGALALCTRRPLLLGLTACPLVALPLAVGGVDLPVAGLMCLGLSLAGRDRPVAAGLVTGLAAALKWTAWPAFPVTVVLLISMRRSGAAGRGAPLRCAVTAGLTTAVLVLPAALRDPAAFVTHVVGYPLGLTDTVSPAASPFPGQLLAAGSPGGRTFALVLLLCSALVLAGSLAVRPPGTAPAAARRLALGLGLAIALMPATRFGYLVYPLVLASWAVSRRGTAARPDPEGTFRWPARSSSPMTSRPARAASRRLSTR
ncbi:glycosyltransferase 87 family protein [Streptomyces sp. NBC_00338]|uniref:glycosyltransferase 87 family protein n=1 Tax=Streptomyces sp. NBC_00338 TaxID=2975715 RepID=UPI00224F8EF2|nr:glycosyltransferase 87 family protein [Streptomyces sp. NBC_00338]MCX5143248.1 glycosyltransferase 87 family protein [Streptomyces sp. NBC_00338]